MWGKEVEKSPLAMILGSPRMPSHWRISDTPNLENVHPKDNDTMRCGHSREESQCSGCERCQECGDCTYCSDCDSHECSCDSF